VIPEAVPIVAYHYVEPGLGLRRYHGDVTKVEVGQVLSLGRAPVMCGHGLHASLSPSDARQYADGVLTKVECWGRVQLDSTKIVAEFRKVVEIIG